MAEDNENIYMHFSINNNHQMSCGFFELRDQSMLRWVYSPDDNIIPSKNFLNNTVENEIKEIERQIRSLMIIEFGEFDFNNELFSGYDIHLERNTISINYKKMDKYFQTKIIDRYEFKKCYIRPNKMKLYILSDRLFILIDMLKRFATDDF